MDNQIPTAPGPQQPTVEASTPTTPTAEKPKSYGRNWKKWILIYLAIGAVIYAGVYYLVLSKQNSKPYSAPVTKTNPSLTPTIASDPTATWKTYVIKPLGLEYKLPPQLSSLGEHQMQTAQGAEGGSRLDITIGNSNALAFGARSKDFQEGREYSFLDSWGYEAKNGKFNGIKYISSKEYSEEISSGFAEEITNPNGLKILKITGKNSPPRDSPIPFSPGKGKIGALVNIPNAGYWRGFAVEMSLKNGLREKDFDQVLQTFKFIDINGTSSWKSYENKNMKFSLKYPTEYSLIQEDVQNASFGSRQSFLPPSEPVPEYLTITTKDLTPYKSYPLCSVNDGKPTFTEEDLKKVVLPCISYDTESRKGNEIMNVKLDNRNAVDFTFTQGPDSLTHVIQTTGVPQLEIRMIVAGGGLENTFQQILSTFKFTQ